MVASVFIVCCVTYQKGGVSVKLKGKDRKYPSPIETTGLIFWVENCPTLTRKLTYADPWGYFTERYIPVILKLFSLTNL